MNEQISWDQSLVKKYSSSNHFKLLNQLRNEVKKYPLKKKSKGTTSNSNDSNLANKNNNSSSNEKVSSKTSNANKEISNNPSNVSFNNSKNFSIYNINNNSPREVQESVISDIEGPNTDTSSSTFKDRLNKIDMK